MASNSNNSGSNRIVVPEAREAMDKFKMEAANEVGVNLKQGYNGDLTSREAGSVGGQMVKKMIDLVWVQMRHLHTGSLRFWVSELGRKGLLA